MIGERHNAPQRNLHANQAGNAGDCKFSTHSSLSWRRLGRFFATTLLASFVLNEIWEMAQMSAYLETAEPSWTSTLALCTRAAVGDVGIIFERSFRIIHDTVFKGFDMSFYDGQRGPQFMAYA